MNCSTSPNTRYMNSRYCHYYLLHKPGVTSYPDHQLFIFLDNDAARSAYIQGVGATNFARSFTQKFVHLESALKILPWFGRVPSHSNISDGPSRLDFSNHLLKHCTRIRLHFPAHFNQMGLASGVLEKSN